jgi:Fe-S-cluster containining protein
MRGFFTRERDDSFSPAIRGTDMSVSVCVCLWLMNILGVFRMLAFECKKCGTCCYGKGGIFIRRDEIERIADFLEMDPASFISRYCDKKHGRFSIKTGEDGYCVFFDKERQCTIHPVNPTPCSSWPFYDALLKDPDNWESAKDACPGINPNCSFEDFVRQAEEELSVH